jgi:hypothetical protein
LSSHQLFNAPVAQVEEQGIAKPLDVSSNLARRTK